MKFNKWTLALAAVGAVSLASVVRAEEANNQVLTALSSTTLSGYVDTSVNWRPGNNTGPLVGRTFDNASKQDGFNLNVVGLTLEKPLDEGQWSAGYKADLVFGPDADYYGTAGSTGAFGGGSGDFNIKQAYAVLRAPVGNGLDIKLGVFDTVIGYEVYEKGNNPNYSRSFGYAIEPTHHTGVLASYHVNDMISVAAGIANSWNAPINGKTGGWQETYMGAVTVTLPETTGILAGSAVYAGVVDGRGVTAGGAVAGQDTTSWYVGHTMATPIEGLAIGAAFDYGDDLPTFSGGDNHAWAAALYASFQATEKLRLNARGEYAKGSTGAWGTPLFDSTGAPITKEAELFGLTLTADYNLWSSLITRLEGRWDHSLNGDVFADSMPPGVGGTGFDKNAFTVALNMIYKF